MKKILKYAPIAAAILLITSCASKKVITNGTQQPQQTTSKTEKGAEKESEKRSLQFVQRIADNSVTTENILTSGDFTLQMGSKQITVPAKLSMRKNECIRIQLLMPILRTELARIEFTPDYVLVVDRWHKEYIKADYNQLAFLKENGLDFYSLQSLFWNELLMPGRQKVGEGDLGKYYVDTSAQGSTLPVSLSQGKLSFCWNAGRSDHKIHSAIVTYGGSGRGSSRLTWNYADFQSVGIKSFPATQSFTFTTSATGKTQQGTISFTLDRVGTNSGWEARTTVSDKYKRIEARDVFDKLLNLQ